MFCCLNVLLIFYDYVKTQCVRPNVHGTEFQQLWLLNVLDME